MTRLDPFETNMDAWREALNARISTLQLSAPQELRRQAGLLARTLIQIMPPSDAAKTRGNIEKHVKILAGYTAPGDIPDTDWDSPQRAGKSDHGDVIWNTFQPLALGGTAREMDVRGDSTEQLYQRLFSAERWSKHGRALVGHRGKQDVWIKHQLLIKKATLAAVVRKVKDHYGRLKAGFIPAWIQLGSPEGGQGAIPGYLSKHIRGARGTSYDELSVVDNPAFTLINFAKGCGAPQAGASLSRALAIRARAMMNDLRFHVKRIMSGEADEYAA
jgi:hypothetical protein